MIYQSLKLAQAVVVTQIRQNTSYTLRRPLTDSVWPNRVHQIRNLLKAQMQEEL